MAGSRSSRKGAAGVGAPPTAADRLTQVSHSPHLPRSPQACGREPPPLCEPPPPPGTVSVLVHILRGPSAAAGVPLHSPGTGATDGPGLAEQLFSASIDSLALFSLVWCSASGAGSDRPLWSLQPPWHAQTTTLNKTRPGQMLLRRVSVRLSASLSLRSPSATPAAQSPSAASWRAPSMPIPPDPPWAAAAAWGRRRSPSPAAVQPATQPRTIPRRGLCALTHPSVHKLTVSRMPARHDWAVQQKCASGTEASVLSGTL